MLDQRQPLITDFFAPTQKEVAHPPEPQYGDRNYYAHCRAQENQERLELGMTKRQYAEHTSSTPGVNPSPFAGY